MSEVETKPVVSESRVRVRYAETDQMGVVYHANYLVWFEIGRVDFIRGLGMDYRSMEREDGLGIAVVDVSARYKAPARYDDELRIETRLVAARGAVIKFGYKVMRNSDDVVLCEGETVHVVVDREMKKRSLPEKYASRFAAVLI
ncbi:acyl-CoA thioesterase [Edaphobacter modestus]|uniref:Acyl-CoA thioester hydrolase n=1 Tax=Edaphobacter modestus TaxID=388466 RepID=A0A4Q7YTA6_9BACT|nr:thioesterase family protein [Edaphobacter modestus]RZU40504.1 acyl-CoA thioester hydrolase [Edaphobacter modestus]